MTDQTQQALAQVDYEIPDEAVEKALDGYCTVPTYGTYAGKFDAMRAALKAAHPLLGTRPAEPKERGASVVNDEVLDRARTVALERWQTGSADTTQMLLCVFAAVQAVAPMLGAPPRDEAQVRAEALDEAATLLYAHLYQEAPAARDFLRERAREIGGVQ